MFILVVYGLWVNSIVDDVYRCNNDVLMFVQILKATKYTPSNTYTQEKSKNSFVLKEVTYLIYLFQCEPLINLKVIDHPFDTYF